MRHPADEARREALLALVAVALLTPRLLKIFRAAGRAREMDRDLRLKHAAELNDLDDQQLARVADLQGEMSALREQLAAHQRDTQAGAPEAPAA